MATVLREMTDGELGAFSRRLRASVIGDLIAAGYDPGQASALADLQVTAALPNDRPPPQHRIRHVVHEDRPVGHVWYGPDPASAEGDWWLYELEISDADRGSGIGTQVLALVELEVRRLGGTTIGLRVFDHNDPARHSLRALRLPGDLNVDAQGPLTGRRSSLPRTIRVPRPIPR